MKRNIERDIKLINKAIHGEKEELIFIFKDYVDEMADSYLKIAEREGLNIKKSDLKKCAFTHLDLAVAKHFARLKDLQNGKDVVVNDFEEYFKFFIRQSMVECLKNK